MSSTKWLGMVPLVGVDGLPLNISRVMEASLLQSLLESAGIECEVAPPSKGFHEPAQYLLLVRADQQSEAAGIIAEARTGGKAAAEAAEREGEAAGDRAPSDVDSDSIKLF